MSSIKTYEDLEAEEKRLQALLYSHRENIKDSFVAVKQGLNPFKQAANTVRKLFSRDKSNPLMTVGVGLGVDVLLKRFLLAKSGWLTKIVIPFFVRNYSTHFVTEYKKNKFFQKIAGFFRKSKNTAAEAMEEMDTAMQEAKQSASSMT
jgi:hypothetical protein